MRNIFITCIAVCILVSSLAANEKPEPTPWQKTLSIDITTTQTGYSDSWVGGEAGSFNWVSNLNGTAERQFHHDLHFKSTLKMSFGQTTTQDEETGVWSRPKKSTDLIDWENVGRYTFGGFVDPYAAFRLETQFFDARKYDHKIYLSPLKLTESVGFAREIYKKEKDVISSRMGFAFRQIFRGDIDSLSTPGQYIDVDSTFTDGGIESVTDVVMVLSDKAVYTGKLGLYKALFFNKSHEVEGTEFEDDWKAIDVNWENLLAMQLSKIIAVNLYTQLLYDKQISKKGRFKETIAVGFVFKLM